jgi:hypothetical protein
MYYDGVPVEDTDIITADQNYDDVCVYFSFEPTITAEMFDRGPTWSNSSSMGYRQAALIW